MSLALAYAFLVGGLLLAGGLAGLVAGLLGVGGGIIMVPAMDTAFGLLGFDPAIYHHAAVGTSLGVIVATGFSSARAHQKRGAVMMDIVRLWAPPIVIASLLGGLSARFYSGDVLRMVFGVVALVLAVNIMLPIQEMLMRRFSSSVLVHRISAAVIGYVSALMGIGGGSLSVPTLSAFGHSMHKAVGTSAMIGVILAIPAAFGFVVSGLGVEGRPPLSLGYFNLPAFLLVGLVATYVAPYGARVAHRLDQVQLQRAFAVFLAIVGLRMLWQAFL